MGDTALIRFNIRIGMATEEETAAEDLWWLLTYTRALASDTEYVVHYVEEVDHISYFGEAPPKAVAALHALARGELHKYRQMIECRAD
jgi:hypothetical protein